MLKSLARVALGLTSIVAQIAALAALAAIHRKNICRKKPRRAAKKEKS